MNIKGKNLKSKFVYTFCEILNVKRLLVITSNVETLQVLKDKACIYVDENYMNVKNIKLNSKKNCIFYETLQDGVFGSGHLEGQSSNIFR